MFKIEGIATFTEKGFHFVNRTSRNYIIHMRVPIIEGRKATEEKLSQMLPLVVGDITFDRREMIED